MADIAALRELYAWMRDENIVYARAGELELQLGPPPSRVVAQPGEPPADDADEVDDERRSLETLLHSSGVEVEPFLRAMRGKRAA